MARYLIDANLPRWFSLWSGGDCEFVHDLGAERDAKAGRLDKLIADVHANHTSGRREEV